MSKLYHPTLYDVCNYLSIPGFQLRHVNVFVQPGVSEELQLHLLRKNKEKWPQAIKLHDAYLSPKD